MTTKAVPSIIIALAICIWINTTLPLVAAATVTKSYSKNARPGPMTCDVYPRICRVPGSPGKDCCKRKCVNVAKDGVNCGQCGKRCRYGQLCCRGSCVNVMNDANNCGGCKNKCRRGGHCRHGLCNYA